MSKTDALQGAYCPLIVPFREEKIDYDTYGELIERQIAEGTHWPTGQCNERRADDVDAGRARPACRVRHQDIVPGRRPVCAGTASEIFDENASLVDRFDKAGADSILVVTPFYSAPPQRGAISYFANLGARTKRPLLIYHIPARAAFTLTVDTLAAIKDRVPHFSGLKNTDTDVGFVTGAFARLGRDLRIFAGWSFQLCRCSAIGGCGMMITASNVAPGMVSQLYDTFAKGDLDAAIALNLKLYPLFRGVALESQPDPSEVYAQAPGRAENQRASHPNGAGVARNREATRPNIGRDWFDLNDDDWTSGDGASLGATDGGDRSQTFGRRLRSRGTAKSYRGVATCCDIGAVAGAQVVAIDDQQPALRSIPKALDQARLVHIAAPKIVAERRLAEGSCC